MGRGLYIEHFGGIFAHSSVAIGENCSISQGVTISLRGRGYVQGFPKIGDRVFVDTGTKVFGSILIKDDVAIGVNAVVTKSLTNKAIVVGILAHSSVMSDLKNIWFIELR